MITIKSYGMSVSFHANKDKVSIILDEDEDVYRLTELLYDAYYPIVGDNNEMLLALSACLSEISAVLQEER